MKILKNTYSSRLVFHWDNLQSDSHYEPAKNFIIEQLNKRNLPLIIFEIGSGTGKLAELLVKNKIEMIGQWDRSKEMRNIAKKRLSKFENVNWINPKEQKKYLGKFSAIIAQRITPNLSELSDIISISKQLLRPKGMIFISYWTGEAVKNFSSKNWPPLDLSFKRNKVCIRFNSWDFSGINNKDFWNFLCFYFEGNHHLVECGEFELTRLKKSAVIKEFQKAGFNILENRTNKLRNMGFTVYGELI